MQSVSLLKPQYAETGRAIQFTLADGSKVLASVDVFLCWEADTITDTAADLLLEWLQEACQKGWASEAQLAALALSCGVRFVPKKHSDGYPGFYLLSPYREKVGHYIGLRKPLPWELEE